MGRIANIFFTMSKNWFFWLIVIILIIIFKKPIFNLIIKCKSKIISYTKKAFHKLLLKIKHFFKEMEFNKYFFVVLMFFMSILLFFLFLLLKEIVPKNFGDISWIQLTALIYFIGLLLFIVLPLYLTQKYPDLFMMYFAFPILTLITLWYNTNYGLSGRAFSIIIIMIFIFHLITVTYIWKPVKTKLLLACFLIILFLNLGISSIDIFTGEKRMDFNLNECNGKKQVLGQIKCEDINSHVIAGHKVYCKFEKIKIDSLPGQGMVTFIYSNGSDETIDLYSNESYSFIVPYDLASISFKLEDNKICLYTRWPVRYPDYNEFKTDKTNFMYLILALLGFCIISIPNIIKKFYDLNK